MDVSGIGGTWNGGEEITVTLDDGDLNLNSLKIKTLNLDQLVSKDSNCYNWFSSYTGRCYNLDYW